MDKKKAQKTIEDIVVRGTREDKLVLFQFDQNTDKDIIRKKFKYFIRGNYPRYFKQNLEFIKSPDFHDDFIMDMINSYFGDNFLQTGFRGCAKTSLKKLFDTYVLLNDKSRYRRYMKVLTKDMKNSKQIVTDVYNLIVQVTDIYGDVFEKEGKMKREETMTSFTMRDGRKYSAGTVGQTQRGHVQDAYRPDWVWFEDVEDKETVRSAVQTQGIIERCGEAINGLSANGSYYVTGNYFNDQGTIQWFQNKESVTHRSTPIMRDINDPESCTWPEMFPYKKVMMIKSDCEANGDDFHGEFMDDPINASDRFFNLNKIEEDLKSVIPAARISAGVHYWGNYIPSHRYGLGSDHSEGVGLDANTACLFDFTTGELMASYANNKIGPDMATHEFARLGMEFGNCIYAPEVNHECGGAAITTLKMLGYPNIYQQEDPTKTKNNVLQKWGWSTNSKTKYNAFYEFRADYNEGHIKIYDERLLLEMKMYTTNDLKDNQAGLVTRHFDLLMAAVIAWQMRKYAQVKKSNYRKAYQNYINSAK